MCISFKAPSPPPPPPLPPPPPAPAPPKEPPPEPVNLQQDINPQVRQTSSKKTQEQTTGSGALRIPLNPVATPNTTPKSGVNNP